MQLIFMKRAAWGVVGAAAMVLGGAAQAAGVPGQGTWETTLLGRDIGGHAVAADSASAVFLYDKTLDVTWLRDANYADTSGYDGSGYMDWWTANTWANTLTVGTYSGWRLPTLRPVNGSAFQYGISNNGTTDSGYAKTGTGWGLASEMGHLFYVTLGNIGYCTPNNASPESCDPQPGWGLSNTGSFQNMQPSAYWSGLQYASDSKRAWDFHTSDGYQYNYYKRNGLYAMAVRPGDVAAVPEPEASVLLLLGLGGLLIARQRRVQ